jgi:hypothetical protein
MTFEQGADVLHAITIPDQERRKGEVFPYRIVDYRICVDTRQRGMDSYDRTAD